MRISATCLTRSTRGLIVWTFFTIVSLNFAFAQSSTSPYTRFGLGDLNYRNFGVNRSLGGSGLGMRTADYLNFANPASYNSVLSNSFAFEVGLKNRLTETSNLSGKELKYTSNIEYLAIKFPITKWWAGSFGLLPYSSKGFTVKNTQYVVHEQDTTTVNAEYVGKGGVNQIYWGNAFKVRMAKESRFPMLASAGVNANYVFGSLDYQRLSSISEGNSTSVIDELKRARLSDFQFNYGLQFQLSDTLKDTRYCLGIVFDNKNNISAKYSGYATRYTSLNGQAFRDTIYNSEGDDDYIEIPQNIGIGLSIEHKQRYTFNADYYMQDWTNTYFLGENLSEMTKSSRMHFGFEYLPELIATQYFKHIRYRVGFQYINSYLTFNEYQLKDMSVSAGLGMPLRNGTIFNFSLEAGQRGTTDYDLIRERYIQFNVNMTLRDSGWFIKRKYF